MMTLYGMMHRLQALQVAERGGDRHHPAIQWAHELCHMGQSVADEVAWCSSIVNLAAALTGYRRSRSAAARSWLNPDLGELETNVLMLPAMLKRMNKSRDDFGRLGASNGVLVFRRGSGRGRLGADVLDAPGHVAVFERYDSSDLGRVYAIGGNQVNAMNVQTHDLLDLIGIVLVARENQT